MGRPFHGPEIAAAGVRRICGKKFIHRDCRQSVFATSGRYTLMGRPFHGPEIVAAGVRRIDLNDDLGLAVTVDVADADRSTGVRQAGAVEIRLQRIAGRRQDAPASRGAVEFHHPEIIATRIRRIDLYDHLRAAVVVDVADADRSTGVGQARTVKIRLQRMTRDWRQVLPASRRGVEFHHPEIVAARVRRIDLNDDLGPAVTVDVADADRSTGVRQTGAVEIRLQRMPGDWRQVLPASRRRVEFHHPEIVAARVRRIDLNNDLIPAVTIDVTDGDRSTGVGQARTVEIRLAITPSLAILISNGSARRRASTMRYGTC